MGIVGWTATGSDSRVSRGRFNVERKAPDGFQGPGASSTTRFFVA